MGLVLIVGIGIICFILLYLAFNIDQKHMLLKLLLIFFAFGLLILIPRGAIDEADNCQVVLTSKTTINTTAGFVSGADCLISFDDGTNGTMIEDSISKTYNFTKGSGFLVSGVRNWNVTCSAVDEDTITTQDTIAVFS